jgi:hypothetical protein
MRQISIVSALASSTVLLFGTDAFVLNRSFDRQNYILQHNPSIARLHAVVHQSDDERVVTDSRRNVIANILLGGSSIFAAVACNGKNANALDMDAFMNSQVQTATDKS